MMTMMMMTIMMMRVIKTTKTKYELREIDLWEEYTMDPKRKKMEQNEERYVAILRNVLGANDKNSNKFD